MITKPALILILSLATTTGVAMDLGGNFWNLGWHKSDDCFQDFKNVTGDAPWNPQFLKEIAIYRSLRFMDWDNTNNSQRDHWPQRPQKTAPRQNPVAYEWMIDLCNRNHSDLWVTIPHKTINRDPAMFDLYGEYLREMAKYFDHFCHYAHVGQAGDRGAWGAIEFTGQLLSEAHKYRALVEWAWRGGGGGQ